MVFSFITWQFLPTASRAAMEAARCSDWYVNNTWTLHLGGISSPPVFLSLFVLSHVLLTLQMEDENLVLGHLPLPAHTLTCLCACFHALSHTLCKKSFPILFCYNFWKTSISCLFYSYINTIYNSNK